VLRPGLTGVGSADFDSRQRSIESCRVAMQASLPRLRTELSKLRLVANVQP
jgi:NTE family protein